MFVFLVYSSLLFLCTLSQPEVMYFMDCDSEIACVWYGEFLFCLDMIFGVDWALDIKYLTIQPPFRAQAVVRARGGTECHGTR